MTAFEDIKKKKISETTITPENTKKKKPAESSFNDGGIDF